MGTVLCVLLLLFELAFLLRIVLSFFPLAPSGGTATVRDLTILVTDPVVLPIRRALPPMGGGLAFPIDTLLILIGLQVIIAIVC